jgi:hypothetical protein
MGNLVASVRSSAVAVCSKLLTSLNEGQGIEYEIESNLAKEFKVR